MKVLHKKKFPTAIDQTRCGTETFFTTFRDVNRESRTLGRYDLRQKKTVCRAQESNCMHRSCRNWCARRASLKTNHMCGKRVIGSVRLPRNLLSYVFVLFKKCTRLSLPALLAVDDPVVKYSTLSSLVTVSSAAFVTWLVETACLALSWIRSVHANQSPFNLRSTNPVSMSHCSVQPGFVFERCPCRS